MTSSSAPFRADAVGSYLRTDAIHEARDRFEAGTLDAAELTAIEDREILELIGKQEGVGLKAVTDGEFRRAWWHFDYSVICIDQSVAMLQALRENAVRECSAFLAALEISHRPFGGRGLEAPVDLAFAIDDFLLHLTTEEKLARFFEELHGWLHPAPGSSLISDRAAHPTY